MIGAVNRTRILAGADSAVVLHRQSRYARQRCRIASIRSGRFRDLVTAKSLMPRTEIMSRPDSSRCSDMTSRAGRVEDLPAVLSKLVGCARHAIWRLRQFGHRVLRG